LERKLGLRTEKVSAGQLKKLGTFCVYFLVF